LPSAVLDAVAAAVAAEATVVGLGESTRSAHETFIVRDLIFRRLVKDHGFRALVIQDNSDVAAALDTYVTTGRGTASAALAEAFSPWKTVEMASALKWIRHFNRDHAREPVRIFGVKETEPRAARRVPRTQRRRAGQLPRPRRHVGSGHSHSSSKNR